MRSQDLARIVAIGASLFACGGCVAHAQGAAYAEADAPVVFTAEPVLVEVDAGVWVVRDADQPVYFVEDDYWVFRDGIWYRSHTYDGGWARVEATVVPVVIAHRDHRMFIHYHGAATAQTRPAPRGHRGDHDRDHHGPPEHAAEQHGGPPGLASDPPGRARAEERHEEHREHAEEHREHAEEHREHAEEHRDDGDPGKGKKHDEKKEEKKDDKKPKKR